MRTKNPEAVLKDFVARYPTQQAAAAALGIGQSYLTDLLRGRRTFSEVILAKLGLRRAVVEAPRARDIGIAFYVMFMLSGLAWGQTYTNLATDGTRDSRAVFVSGDLPPVPAGQARTVPQSIIDRQPVFPPHLSGWPSYTADARILDALRWTSTSGPTLGPWDWPTPAPRLRLDGTFLSDPITVYGPSWMMPPVRRYGRGR